MNGFDRTPTMRRRQRAGERVSFGEVHMLEPRDGSLHFGALLVAE